MLYLFILDKIIEGGGGVFPPMDVAWYNYLYGNFGALTNIILPWIGVVPCDNVGGRCMCSYSFLLTLFPTSRIGIDLILMSHIETHQPPHQKNIRA